MLQPQVKNPTNVSFELSTAEIEGFKDKGWLGPYKFLSEDVMEMLTTLYIKNRHRLVSGKEIIYHEASTSFEEKPWFKSVHFAIHEFREILSSPVLVRKLNSLLGQNILLWGTSVTIREPGQIHRWHIDVEHKKWPGVSLFVGLKGTNSESSLKVISGSHKINIYPDFKNILTDEDVLIEAKKIVKNAQLETINIHEGEFFIFDGLLWHGSENNSKNTRHSIIAQYCQTNSKVEIPLNWDEPILWSEQRPPCALVSGCDRFGFNVLI